jgi:ribonuclease HI
VIIDADGSMREFSGANPSTTNNRMEITAAIEALRNLPAGAEVTIHSDSQYLIKTMTLGWKRAKNLDLWHELDAKVAQRKVRWEWVRGHAGDPLNERADALAQAAANSQLPIARAVAASASSAITTGAGSNTASENNSEAEALRALRPLLREDETIRRCVNCGRAFVASGDASDAFAYCALASCQLKKRQSPLE